jgi:homoserine dehydrogenase
MPRPTQIIPIGLAGLGTVGAGVYKNLAKNADLLESRTGARLTVSKVAVRDPSRPRPIKVPEGLITGDWRDLIADPEIKIIAELIGGVDEAHQLVVAALKAGKVVVTGNKALLAEHGRELISLSENTGTPLYLEAAVAGGIPIIKAVREALVGNEIISIHGIINGTSNFILSAMDTAGLPFSQALGEAQAAGYAEADPALDINGWDAGHKAIILAWLSYGRWLHPSAVQVAGIEGLQLEDVHNARELGYAIKSLAVIRRHPGELVEIRVGPCLIPLDHILASVNGVYNAVAVHGDVVGHTLFYGSGAGQDATSSAVIADLADAAKNLVGAAPLQEGFVPHGEYGQPLPPERSSSAYYLRLKVEDKPGVLAQITRALGDQQVGISVVRQHSAGQGGMAPLLILTHRAPLANMHAAITEIAALPPVAEPPVCLRVEDFSDPHP